jgi:hypothetical protein
VIIDKRGTLSHQRHSLATARRRALLEYGAMIGSHGRLVRRRWILGESEVDDPILHADELGPVADTLTLYQAIRTMRIVPVSKFPLFAIVIPALFSIQVPLKDILMKIVNILYLNPMRLRGKLY